MRTVLGGPGGMLVVDLKGIWESFKKANPNKQKTQKPLDSELTSGLSLLWLRLFEFMKFCCLSQEPERNDIITKFGLAVL